MAEQYRFNGRRNKERITARKGALAFNGMRSGQIVDCSLDGLCFQYRGTKGSAMLRHARGEIAVGSLDIVFGAHGFTLIDLPVNTIADYQMSTLPTKGTDAAIRRRFVTFGQLNPDQLSCLKRFLQLNKFGVPAYEIDPATDLIAGGTNVC